MEKNRHIIMVINLFSKTYILKRTNIYITRNINDPVIFLNLYFTQVENLEYRVLKKNSVTP